MSKPTKDDYDEFNEHDRTKARLIIDGYTTDPETIIAGESFNLLLTVKNCIQQCVCFRYSADHGVGKGF